MFTITDLVICINHRQWYTKNRLPSIGPAYNDKLKITRIVEGDGILYLGFDKYGEYVYNAKHFRKLIDYRANISSKELLNMPIEIPTPIREYEKI